MGGSDQRSADSLERLEQIEQQLAALEEERRKIVAGDLPFETFYEVSWDHKLESIIFIEVPLVKNPFFDPSKGDLEDYHAYMGTDGEPRGLWGAYPTKREALDASYAAVLSQFDRQIKNVGAYAKAYEALKEEENAVQPECSVSTGF